MQEGNRNTPPDSAHWISNPVLALCAILAGAVIALALLNAYFGGRKTNFEDAAALGAQAAAIRRGVT